MHGFHIFIPINFREKVYNFTVAAWILGKFNEECFPKRTKLVLHE